MTRSNFKKVTIISFLFLIILNGSFLWGSQKISSPNSCGFSVGQVPLYYFSVEPEGGNYQKHFFTGTSLSLFLGHQIGRTTVRLGFLWNLLFLTGEDKFETLHMVAPYLQILFNLKYNFYGGAGIAGIVIPGKEKFDGLQYKTRFDLWYSLLAGYNFKISEKMFLFTEINYSLNLTHHQWSEARDTDGTKRIVYTKGSQMVTLYLGIKKPL